LRDRRLHVLALAAFVFIPALNACASRSQAPVQDRAGSVRQPESTYRQVRAGDTLYSIAWESGRDYREVAAWNTLEPPYVIKPGQKIRLYPPAVRKAAGSTSSQRIVAKGDTLYGIAKSTGIRYQDLALWNSLEPPYRLKPGQRLRLTPTGEVAAAPSAPPTIATQKSSAGKTAGTRPIEWIWPTEGAVIARFAPNDAAKGIDIGGTSGQTIRAAASGTVVYQGSGLRGYGQLIIIKHNADFLSAYAHCAAIYVQEGSVIKPGQKIAAMGSTGTDRIKLHFEVRRRGVPVDPLEYLPKK
jgi:lipoprotein NlpD